MLQGDGSGKKVSSFLGTFFLSVKKRRSVSGLAVRYKFPACSYVQLHFSVYGAWRQSVFAFLADGAYMDACSCAGGGLPVWHLGSQA